MNVPTPGCPRPVVLLDCDGPLSAFTEAYLGVVKTATGFLATLDDVDRWDIHKCAFFERAATDVGWTPAQLKSHVIRAICSPGFCDTLRVKEGAKEAVARLVELADVYVVTSPWDSSPTWMYERLHWVSRHFGLPRSRVIQTGTKHLIRGDVFVDDKASHVAEWRAAWPGADGLLFDMHHNKLDGLNAYRAGWPEVIAATEKRATNSQEMPGSGRRGVE